MLAEPLTQSFALNNSIVNNFLRYASFISKRGLVCNTFGNIAFRSTHNSEPVAYTKHNGISLEEMDETNIVVLDLQSEELIHGSIMPSKGFRMHSTILKMRPDINATLHLHPNIIISYFSIFGHEPFEFISNDTALVLGKPVKIMDFSTNVEIDVEPLIKCVPDTNCIIMPQHGITVYGHSLSEAYQRACSIIAEVERLYNARILAEISQRKMPYVAKDEVEHMYRVGQEYIYGNRK